MSTATALPPVAATSESLAERYARVRGFSDTVCETLEPEDCCIQSMPDVSPTRWHLAHTTWFFETFVLARQPGYAPSHDEYLYLFNSYYNAVGEQFPRPRRGLLSRPTVGEVLGYRRAVDEQMTRLLESDAFDPDGVAARVIELGLHHEQQHQELILTDIKHVLACNPLYPIYRAGRFPGAEMAAHAAKHDPDWLEYDEGLYRIGHTGQGFAYDNESPRHRVFLESFHLRSRLVTCGEYLEFIDDGGYQRPELWLSEGWQLVKDDRWQAPLYWQRREGVWHEFTLAGLEPVDPRRPVVHMSYFEADAFARWAGARLPTEAEWEVASEPVSLTGNFADTLLAADAAVHPSASLIRSSKESAGVSLGPAADASPQPSAPGLPTQMFGDVWEWTASSYAAYPGYESAAGALGEYNGKFMCNQYVLRGGSCATSSDHIRRTYRNFFPAHSRWQFSGIRLAK